jgi:hypothetical protein
LRVIHGDHKRAIIGLSFDISGEYIASMGFDNNRSVALYRWKKEQSLEKMRIGVDKGHSDDVYQLAYNPVTHHVVAGGKKFLRFFGLKEGALNDPEKDARAAAKSGGSHTPALSESESKIWAKKGTFGADKGAQDVMSITFDHEGVTYAGSGAGIIYRFSEQATDAFVLAHPLPDGTNWFQKSGDANWYQRELCRVTALWYDQTSGNLYSSGDDGWLQQWDLSAWDSGSPNVTPKMRFDMNPIVLADGFTSPYELQLKGTIVKMDDKELDKDDPKRGSPAAAHSIYGDSSGKLLIGTVPATRRRRFLLPHATRPAFALSHSASDVLAFLRGSCGVGMQRNLRDQVLWIQARVHHAGTLRGDVGALHAPDAARHVHWRRGRDRARMEP